MGCNALKIQEELTGEVLKEHFPGVSENSVLATKFVGPALFKLARHHLGAVAKVNKVDVALRDKLLNANIGKSTDKKSEKTNSKKYSDADNELLKELENVDTSRLSATEGLWVMRNGTPDFGNPFVTSETYIKEPHQFYIGSNENASIAYYKWLKYNETPEGYNRDKTLLDKKRITILDNLSKVRNADKLRYSGTAKNSAVSHVNALIKVSEEYSTDKEKSTKIPSRIFDSSGNQLDLNGTKEEAIAKLDKYKKEFTKAIEDIGSEPDYDAKTVKYWEDMFKKRLAEVQEDLDDVSNGVYDKEFKNTENTATGFQGYVGGFEDKGKGTPEGDGKDKAMRKVANGFIGESVTPIDVQSLKQIKPTSSTVTSFKEIGIKVSHNDYSNTGVTLVSGTDHTIVMLARNSEFKGKPLAENTKDNILESYKDGATFVVGDMPGVDTQFIEYLNEIGASYKIYHTGSTARIKEEIRIEDQINTSSTEVKNKATSTLTESNVTEASQKIKDIKGVIETTDAYYWPEAETFRDWRIPTPTDTSKKRSRNLLQSAFNALKSDLSFGNGKNDIINSFKEFPEVFTSEFENLLNRKYQHDIALKERHSEDTWIKLQREDEQLKIEMWELFNEMTDKENLPKPFKTNSLHTYKFGVRKELISDLKESILSTNTKAETTLVHSTVPMKIGILNGKVGMLSKTGKSLETKVEIKSMEQLIDLAADFNTAIEEYHGREIKDESVDHMVSMFKELVSVKDFKPFTLKFNNSVEGLGLATGSTAITMTTNADAYKKVFGSPIRMVLHEYVHTITQMEMKNNPNNEVVKKIQALYDRVKNREELKGEYGLTDVYEFVAEALSNPRFQAKLDKIGSKHTLVNKIKELFKALLAWRKDKGEVTALDEILDLAVELKKQKLDDSKDATISNYFNSYSSEVAVSLKELYPYLSTVDIKSVIDTYGADAVQSALEGVNLETMEVHRYALVYVDLLKNTPYVSDLIANVMERDSLSKEQSIKRIADYISGGNQDIRSNVLRGSLIEKIWQFIRKLLKRVKFATTNSRLRILKDRFLKGTNAEAIRTKPKDGYSKVDVELTFKEQPFAAEVLKTVVNSVNNKEIQFTGSAALSLQGNVYRSGSNGVTDLHDLDFGVSNSKAMDKLESVIFNKFTAYKIYDFGLKGQSTRRISTFIVTDKSNKIPHKSVVRNKHNRVIAYSIENDGVVIGTYKAEVNPLNNEILKEITTGVKAVIVDLLEDPTIVDAVYYNSPTLDAVIPLSSAGSIFEAKDAMSSKDGVSRDKDIMDKNFFQVDAKQEEGTILDTKADKTANNLYKWAKECAK